MIATGGFTFPEPDVTNCGGVTAFLKIAHVAEAFNLPITSHGAHDVTIQLLAALPNRSYLEVHGFGLERFLLHPFELADGMATNSIGAGWTGFGPVERRPAADPRSARRRSLSLA